ncbi:MAG TPA: IS5 family transposase [Candidatus Acidoferrales bacterium]|nr:IS5 family transposase [Candidatus Acidoferrales bacterium]
MRGTDQQQNHVFSYISPDERVRKDHPLRPIRTMVDQILKQLSPQFDRMYAKVGRPSIPPEQLLRAQLLQMFYSVRSERLLMEEMDYNILFRWFVGLNLDDAVWDATVFTKNRDRLLEAEVAKEFLARVVAHAREQGWMSDEHFTVDGTLLDAWASLKSFQRKDKTNSNPPEDPGNPTVDFHGEKRSNWTHESKSDPDAQLMRKGRGKEAKLSYSGNLLVENRNGLIVSSLVWEATGTAEPLAAMAMLQQIPGTGRVTVGGDKGFDTAEFVRECRNMGITPHVAQNLGRRGGSAIDSRTTQHAGYRISQKKRKRIEECFGWLKTVALLRKMRHRGTLKVDWMFTFACAAYNLVRMRNLMAAAVATQ